MEFHTFDVRYTEQIHFTINKSNGECFNNIFYPFNYVLIYKRYCYNIIATPYIICNVSFNKSNLGCKEGKLFVWRGS